MRAILIRACLGTALLAGCKPAAHDPLEAVAPNAIWEVVQIAGKPVPQTVEVTLTHPEKGLIAGRSGCNRYNGRISEQNGRVRVGELAGTRLSCPADELAVEEAFRSAMARVDAVTIAKDRLELLGGGVPVIVATQ